MKPTAYLSPGQRELIAQLPEVRIPLNKAKNAIVVASPTLIFLMRWAPSGCDRVMELRRAKPRAWRVPPPSVCPETNLEAAELGIPPPPMT